MSHEVRFPKQLDTRNNSDFGGVIGRLDGHSVKGAIS